MNNASYITYSFDQRTNEFNVIEYGAVDKDSGLPTVDPARSRMRIVGIYNGTGEVDPDGGVQVGHWFKMNKAGYMQRCRNLPFNPQQVIFHHFKNSNRSDYNPAVAHIVRGDLF